ncbi:MAG: V-type ATP synthase subunit I [Chlamydiales bacterium]|nr:V-type ATP synthase subunit I [Chlamydiales bacterium]
MRIDVIKYLVMGPMSNRDRFFRRIQEEGIVEFISHRPPSLETPPEIQNFTDALHVLRQMVPVKQEPTDDYRSARVLARHVVERSQELEHLEERSRVLEKEIDRIKIFGDFSLEDLRDIEHKTGRVFQFFFSKKSELLEAPKRPEVIFIGHGYGLDYFLSINSERRNYEGFIEILIERSLGDLQEELAQIKRQIDEYETELATLAHKKKPLQNGLIDALNRYHLEDSKERLQPLLDGEMFAVEGWVPKNKIKTLEKVASELNVFIEPVKVEEEDRVPTYLENKGFGRIGQDLISIYDTPSSTDRDPSLWVFIAFGIFFSMILADTGYGLLLLGLSIYLYFKFRRKTGLGKRVILLMMSLSIGSIFWGAMLTSFFGVDVAPDSKLRQISLIHWMVNKKADYFLTYKPKAYDDLIQDYPQLRDATTSKELLMGVTREQEGMNKYVIYNNFTNDVLIELSIFIGTIHIILSFLRYLDRNWAGLGWITFMVGSYLYFPLVLGALSLIHYVFHIPYQQGGEIGRYLLFAGLGMTVVIALIQHRLRGLGEIMHVIEVFADVMSYLRIYALSLAGIIMATTFDQIGTGMPLYIGIFVILAGHAINLTLAVMGGIIHGLRLNFIEWYHYSFEGGGKDFHPLSLIKID